MDTTRRSDVTSAWIVTGAAAALLAITMGQRSALGLFMSPLNTATGLGLATISFAMAFGQIVWGAAQPGVALLVGRFGAFRVIALGALALAAGTAIVPTIDSAAGLVGALALGAAAGAAVGSNALLLGLVSQRVAPSRRGLAAGIVGAGGSAGQLLIAPLAGLSIAAAGWINAVYVLAALSLAAVPLARLLEPRSADPALPSQPAPSSQPAPNAQAAPPSVVPASSAESAIAPQLGDALRSRAYWLVTAGFFVCGFHTAFLLAHMPGVIELCGLPSSLSGMWLAIVGLCNIAGSLLSGVAIRRVPMKWALAALYAARAAGVIVFLLMPKTAASLLAFAVWMGVTYMATLPPTSGLIGRLFGVDRLGPLLGVTMFVHQIGGFLGVWLGGLAVAWTGSYDLLWMVDAALAVVAALVHLPLREPRERRASRPAAGTLTPSSVRPRRLPRRLPVAA